MATSNSDYARKFVFEANLNFSAGSAFGIPGPLVGGTIAISGESWPKLSALASRLSDGLGGTALPVIPSHGNADEWLEGLLILCLVTLHAVKVPGGTARDIRVQRTSQAHEGARFSVTVRAWSLVAFKRTLAWLLAAYQDQDQSVDWAALRQQLQSHSLQGTNAFRFVMAARRLGYEIRPMPLSLWAFGTGAKQRWFDSSFTDQTPHIAAALARNKMATASILRSLGFPAPVHVLVDSRERAVEAAVDLGYPVVIKPADREQGKGVAADLKDAEAVLEAYDAALALSRHILVEKHFHGEDYRITVVEGEIVKVVHRRPGGVVGDGLHTVVELLEMVNEDPLLQRRSRDRGMAILELDAQALGLLREQGLEPHSVISPQVFVRLRRKANISAGGSGVWVAPESVHPDNKSLAIRATSALNLDISGVDLLIPDIARSWLETGALICEINAQPQIGTNTSPQIYDEILLKLLGSNPQIPSYLVIAPEGIPDRDLVPRMGDFLSRPGTGFSSGEMLYLGGKPFAKIPGQAHLSARALLANRCVERAVMRISVPALLEHGLPCHDISAVIFWDEERSAADDHSDESAHLADCLRMMGPHCRRWMRIGSTAPSPGSWAAAAAQVGIHLEPFGER